MDTHFVVNFDIGCSKENSLTIGSLTPDRLFGEVQKVGQTTPLKPIIATSRTMAMFSLNWIYTLKSRSLVLILHYIHTFIVYRQSSRTQISGTLLGGTISTRVQGVRVACRLLRLNTDYRTARQLQVGMVSRCRHSIKYRSNLLCNTVV
jgi:hypothetical protein